MTSKPTKAPRCGACKQFTRIKDNVKDLCEAWGQPTTADRQACEFFLPKSFAMYDPQRQP